MSAFCERIDQQIAPLDVIVMREETSRYTSIREKTRKIDDYDSSVERVEGTDRIADLRRNGGRYSGMTVVRGLWSSGEFSTMLRITREAVCAGPADIRPVYDAEHQTTTASFRSPASSDHWFVTLGPHVYWLDFRGEIRLSTATGDVLSIAWTSISQQPAGIRQIDRAVMFGRMKIGEKTYTLPEMAEYRVVYASGRAEWNDLRFHDPARYGSLASVNYEDSR